MGWHLAKACALVLDPPLSANAQVVLARMAWVAMDAPRGDKPAATYWGGWEYLGMSLAHGRTDAAVERLVFRAIAELVSKGYVKPLGSAHLGQRQHYQITVDY